MAVASASLDAIAAKMQEHDIEKTVLLASYFPHKQSGISNYRLLHWINDRLDWNDGHSQFCMFGSLDFEHYFYQGYNELEELAGQNALQGIKIYTSYQHIDLASEKMDLVARLAAKKYLLLMFHVGSPYTALRTPEPASIANTVTPRDVQQVAQRHPDVSVIIAHMGMPFLDDLVESVKANDNLYADMSGLIDSKYDRPEIPGSIEAIKRFVGECGSKRLLFGSDFPVQTHEDAIAFIEEAGLTAEQKADIYYNNAARLLPC